jgi:hypothetical protein
MRLNQWEKRRSDQRVCRNADEVELRAVKSGSATVEFGIFDDQIADSLDDYETNESNPMNSWAENDLTLESAVSDIASEILRRKSILGDAYPFLIDKNTIRYTESEQLVYEFCLAVSVSPSLSEAPYNELPEAFERLVSDIVISWSGPGSDGVRTGWPRRGSSGERASFRETFEVIGRATSECIWRPNHSLPDNPDPVNVKDEGVDVVVWKRLGDKRIGSLFMIGQCACGNDFDTKYADCSVERLSKWFHPFSYAKVVRFFATPRHIGNDTLLMEMCGQAGITFDRARLTTLGRLSDRMIPHRETLRRLIDLLLV